MNKRLSHVIATVFDRPWYLRQEQLATISAIVRFHAEGGSLDREEILSRVEAANAAAGPRRGARTMSAVAIIPVYGAIFPRANILTEFSGGATVEGIRGALREALADEAVGSIVLEFDSPGGYTDGIDELATEIFNSRGQKPIVASSCYLMASAAYYLGSQADEVVASSSSEVGWIGTALVHQEFSKMDELAGVTTTIIRNPPGKYGGNEYEPLSDAARAEFQAVVDERSAQFTNAVARGRGVSTAKVRSDFGQGGGMTASRAKAVGLVDRIETIDETVRRLATGKGPVSRGTSGYVAVTPEPDPTDGGDGQPVDDPDAPASGETGTPPAERSIEVEAALALARAQVR